MYRTAATFVPFIAALAVATGSLASAQVASAAGGSNIAAAPTAVVGQQEFGNTTDGCYLNCYGADYWKLSLIAGDHVRIDWESSGGSECNSYVDELKVWPIGTTDFSINNASPFQQFGIGANNKAESTFTANATGVFPLMFEACDDPADAGGPYDFTVNVRHLARLSFQVPSRIPTRTRVHIQAHYPDGTAINGAGLIVQIRGWWSRSWHVLGSATPVGGVASVLLTIPHQERGKVIKLEAAASGTSFLGSHTGARQTRVR
jgi:hypothetical protein